MVHIAGRVRVSRAVHVVEVHVAVVVIHMVVVIHVVVVIVVCGRGNAGHEGQSNQHFHGVAGLGVWVISTGSTDLLYRMALKLEHASSPLMY